MKFQDKLEKIITRNNSLLCIGLDPDPQKFPKYVSIFNFNKHIIDQTFNFVCAFKPNIAFFEAEGIRGLEQLKKTIDYLKSNYPHIPIILDAKRADIPNTAKMYAKAVFEYWQADATTVYPHLGYDSLEPFLSYENCYTFLLVKTSNPDSGTFQNLETKDGLYYLSMAQEIKKWIESNIGIFVGTTYPAEVRKLRDIFPNKVFLSAGVGAQGAQLEKSVKAGLDRHKKGIIFNASRSIIYSESPRIAAQKLRDEINKYR